jgi:hypothetical protein
LECRAKAFGFYFRDGRIERTRLSRNFEPPKITYSGSIATMNFALGRRNFILFSAFDFAALTVCLWACAWALPLLGSAQVCPFDLFSSPHLSRQLSRDRSMQFIKSSSRSAN